MDQLVATFLKSVGKGGGLDLSGANAQAATAQATGQNAINSFDPTGTANSQEQTSNNLFGQQQGATQNYVNQYAQDVANNPTVTSLYQQGNQLYNVPQLQTQATNLQNQVTNAVPAGVSAARGFDIGDTQVNNGVAQKLAYLQPQANAATANANTASQLASQFVQAGQQQNAQNLLPVQAQQSLLAQNMAAQATGWNQAMANQFQGLIDKMQSGVQLSQAEYQQAQALAQAEESYQQAQVTANAQIQAAQIGQQYQTLNPTQTLVNTFTGQSQRAK